MKMQSILIDELAMSINGEELKEREDPPPLAGDNHFTLSNQEGL